MFKMIKAFTKHNPKYKRPEEDSFGYEIVDIRTIVAVADGITRDLINGIYPNPSPAKVAANLFVDSFILEARKSNSVERAIEYSNNKIADLNRDLKVDYLVNDYRSCVGVGGIIENYQLNYGFIADCGVCVFSKEGKLKFRTQNEGPNSSGSIDSDVIKKYGVKFSEPKGREIIRSRYRNNLDEPLSYGAFTGEKNAISYVRIGRFILSSGDYVIFYSDGFAPMLYSDEFNILKEYDGLEDYFDLRLDKIDGAEGTLVALKIDDEK